MKRSIEQPIDAFKNIVQHLPTREFIEVFKVKRILKLDLNERR